MVSGRVASGQPEGTPDKSDRQIAKGWVFLDKTKPLAHLGLSLNHAQKFRASLRPSTPSAANSLNIRLPYTHKRIVEAQALYPECATALDQWYRVVKKAEFKDFAELRWYFNSVDKVGQLYVFNVGGNKLRIVAAVHFNTRKVFIRHVLTHAEYDKLRLV